MTVQTVDCRGGPRTVTSPSPYGLLQQVFEPDSICPLIFGFGTQGFVFWAEDGDVGFRPVSQLACVSSVPTDKRWERLQERVAVEQGRPADRSTELFSPVHSILLF